MQSSRRSSRSSANLVEARLQPSRLQALLLFAVHLAAALPALSVPIAPGVAAGWLLAVVCSLVWCLRRPRVLAVRQLPDGRWRLTLTEGEWDGQLISWYVHPWLCAAIFRGTPSIWRAVVVPYWSAPPEVHRRLRVALRAAELPHGLLFARLRGGRDRQDA